MTGAQGALRPVEVAEDVYWVGAVDWAVRDFHGYATPRGTTYNAYLIVADRITLVDTVKAPFSAELMERIAAIVPPERISYIVSNHAEMDHSGALPQVMEAVRPEKVFASKLGVKALERHFHLDGQLTAVADGESMDIGGRTLSFVEARMLHWPDSMMTYLTDEKLLLPSDAFGMHLASSRRFADEIEDGLLEREAAKYYANILLPLSPLIGKLLARVQEMGIEIAAIGPSHGPIWRRDPERVIGWYARWAAGEPKQKAVLVYDTMWGSTEKMAQSIADGLSAAGVEVKVMPLRASHRSDVATEILDAGALLVGSPTLNNEIFPTIADALTYLKGLRPRGLIGGAFGSYGWAGGAVGRLEEGLKAMNVELAVEGLAVEYVPDRAALARCFAWGAEVAQKLKSDLAPSNGQTRSGDEMRS